MTVMVSAAELVGCGVGQDSCSQHPGNIPQLAPAYIKQHLDAIYNDDAYRMIWFKVYLCPKAFNHDWTACPFAHPGERARRRCLLTFNYSAKVCPDMQNKGTCPRGDECSMTHTMFEYWMHPQRYRTRMCKDSSQCKRHFCFFAHASEELRMPSDAPLTTAAAGSNNPMSPAMAVLPGAVTVGVNRAAQLSQMGPGSGTTHTVYLPGSGHLGHSSSNTNMAASMPGATVVAAAAGSGSPQPKLQAVAGSTSQPGQFGLPASMQPLGAAAFFGQQTQTQPQQQFYGTQQLVHGPSAAAVAAGGGGMGPANLALQFQQMQLGVPNMQPACPAQYMMTSQPAMSGQAAAAQLALMSAGGPLGMLPAGGLMQQHQQQPHHHNQQQQQQLAPETLFMQTAVTAGLLQPQGGPLGGLLGPGSAANAVAAASAAQLVPLCQGLLMNGLGAADSGELPLGAGACQPLAMSSLPVVM